MQKIQADIIPVIRHIAHNYTHLPGRRVAEVHSDLPELTMDFAPFDLLELMAGLLKAALKTNFQQPITLWVAQEDPSHITIKLEIDPLSTGTLQAFQPLITKMDAQYVQPGVNFLDLVIPIVNQEVFWSPDQVLQLYIKN